MVRYLRNTLEPSRNRYTVIAGKRCGKAVQRNRIKRRLRALVRQEAAAARPGFDYVVVARRDAILAPFPELTREFVRALERVHGDRRGRPGPETLRAPE